MYLYGGFTGDGKNMAFAEYLFIGKEILAKMQENKRCQ